MLALGALGCEAAFSLLAAPHLARLGPQAVSAYACPFALPILLIWSLAAGEPDLPLPTTAETASIVYLGVAVTSGGFLAWYSAIGILGVERAGLFSGVLPVSALVCSAALGVAEVTPARLAAVVVVAAGDHPGHACGTASAPTRTRWRVSRAPRPWGASIASRTGTRVVMAAVSIRDLDDGVRDRLRVRAARHGRSMEAEIRVILADAVTESRASEGLFTVLLDRFGEIGGVEFELPPRATSARAPDLGA